jgi:adenine phosphoribosyltransferase
MDLASLLRDVPDFPKPGILFKDITPLLASPAGMTEAIARLAAFDFGVPLAMQLGIGFVPVRKPGKLPWKTNRVEYMLEYGTDAIEIHQDAIRPGERVLLIDDVLATGGTMGAAVELVHACGGTVAGCAFVVELGFLHGRKRLGDHRIESLVVLN